MSFRCLCGPPAARARRACALRRVGAPGCEEVVSEGGREARNRPHTQLTAGGRTLVDADRIKAARIGDPRWRRSNRARLPTADQAIHASDSSSQGSTCQRAASLILFSSFFDVFYLHSSIFNPVPTPGHRGRARHCACAQRRVGGAPGCGVVVDEGGGRLSHACVCEPVSSSLAPTRLGRPSDRRGAPKHRFAKSNCSHDVRVGAPPSAAW
ncbi:hypothetical protein EVAR_32266_1 [Eumeta japonica]|uniref:Uncharacterized protein n=1 Tax=Eumeta variegata TaxID=151549 RepID=A0A4C1WXW0_EUMVA|nr:hypothetical protein EVAR_32266_1 [Eumeta japonica]